MLRHLLFWLLPPITLYFPTYTYFRQFWVKSQRSITLNNSKTRNGRVHICHSTRCWKSHLASDNYDSRGHFKSENRPKNYYCAKSCKGSLLVHICSASTQALNVFKHSRLQIPWVWLKLNVGDRNCIKLQISRAWTHSENKFQPGVLSDYTVKWTCNSVKKPPSRG